MMLAALLVLVPSALLAAAPATALPSPHPSAPETRIESYVTRAMEAWKVPGVAIAVVKDDKVVLARGFGVREAGKPARVDDKTLFAIGSLTKGFTAAAVGVLVDEGKLAWDDPVLRHLPSFCVADPYVTRELTLRDVLSHRSGLNEADALWYGTTYSRADILSRLRHVTQASGLRSTFSYSNVLYLVAGEALATRAGSSWDDLVRKRLFEPLGMTASRTGVRGLDKVRNVARPHSDAVGEMHPIAFLDGDNVAPAAALVSNAQDMARWMRMLLGRGSLEGHKVLSPETVETLFSPHMVVPRGPYSRQIRPESHLEAAGLGWMLRDWHGRLLVWNTGGMDGMSSSVGLLPEENLGIIVLTNGGRTSFPEALVARLLEVYTGKAETDWSWKRLQASLAFRQRQVAARQAREEARVRDTKPTLPLARYTGTYAQSLLGELTVAEQKGRLMVRLAGWEGEAEHWHLDTFRVKWSDPERGTVRLTFQLDAEGTPTRLVVEDWGEFQRRG